MTQENNTLAYIDTLFHGLIPCKVLDILPDGSMSIRVTATRGAYKRGESIEIAHQHIIIPRALVRKHTDGYCTIIGTHKWKKNPMNHIIWIHLLGSD